ncbi:TRAP-type mannitol/chloroaromatic compound transport system, small permease component [Desulfocicer vacuolatum DSM 3385]|uniref:TRAP-type mannitol/chloroaromatic compound transport system, small permease component n=1 Tax=Desulfocicer vacuolatum DSM 3385 TaxID=1121400 RepID=A0A1W2CPX2_9BACT|nr:TRAP transporter small permease [Desulfocicer vacuolatum]SMC87251.1 TRAP-type mannitol/chloroaromatic compound transport system, small permease component [Desulfocicer vacuolatum DSM 3385]
MPAPTDFGLELFLSRCKTVTRQLNRWALALGMGWVLVMMCLTTLDVAGRHFMSSPVPGTIELSEFMLAVFGILGIAYTHESGANVRVTLLIDKLPRRIVLFLTAFTDFLAFQIISMLAWYAGVMVLEEFHSGTTTDTLAIPVYPLYVLLCAGAFLLALEIMVDMIVSFVSAVRGKEITLQ